MKTRIFSFFHKNIFTRTAKNTLFVFSGNSLSMVFAFFFTIILARMLSLSDFGYFSALLSFMLLSSDMADIGIGSSLSRFLPPLETDQTKLLNFLKSSFYVQLIIACIFTILIFLFSPYLNNLVFHNTILDNLIKITAIGVFGSIMINFFQNALLARQKFMRASVLSALGGFIRLFFLVILILLQLQKLNTVVLVQTISLLTTAFIGISLLNINFLKASHNKSDVKTLLSFSAYLGIARGLTAIAGKIDVLMLIAFTNSVEAGIYAMASRVTSIYPLLSGSFSTVIAPRISTLKAKEELKHFLKKVIFATFGLVASIMILILFSNFFMSLLFGQKGLLSVSVFRLLLISMIFFVASIPSVSVAIYYLKKPIILTVNSILQVALVIGCNFIFIPVYGKEGAAYASIVTFGVTLITTSVMSYIFFLRHEQ